MAQRISDIQQEFQAAQLDILPDFIKKYGADERNGVRLLVKRAEKRLDSLEKEKSRLFSMKAYERKYNDLEYICGIDEVGRGPLAGPVAAGAVILPKDCDILYLNDSKQLSAKMREKLSAEIMKKAVAWGIGIAGPERIDEINILNATYEAMRSAVQKLAVVPDILLNDACVIPGIATRQVKIIKGDTLSVSIAAASIIAKVYRDALMVRYEEVYPGYGFAANKGYGSKEHIKAIREYGPTPIHRRSFLGNFIERESASIGSE